MKSIKEKAEEYGYANWQSDDYHEGASEGLDFDPIGHTQKSFEAGANYVLEEFAKIVRGNLTCISKAVQKLFEAKYLQLTGNKMFGGFKD